jgi:hypothetical protein
MGYGSPLGVQLDSVCNINAAASHYGMLLFRQRRADQFTAGEIYRKAEKLLQQHWIWGQQIDLGNKIKERFCCDRNAPFRF